MYEKQSILLFEAGVSQSSAGTIPAVFAMPALQL